MIQRLAVVSACTQGREITDRSHRGHTNPLTDPDFFIGFAYYRSSSQPFGVLLSGVAAFSTLHTPVISIRMEASKSDATSGSTSKARP
jgi:hypothetical protein